MKITPSTRYNKRFKATFNNGIVTHFGQRDPVNGTYIDHGDENKRNAYIARHSKLENWNDPYAAGTLSRYILWGDSTNIIDNINLYRKKFNL